MDATPALLRGEIWQGEIEIFGFKGNKVEGEWKIVEGVDYMHDHFSILHFFEACFIFGFQTNFQIIFYDKLQSTIDCFDLLL